MNTVTVRGLSIGRGKPKVCIPVMGKNDDDIMLQAGEAVARGADLIEWRVDSYDCAFQPECIRNVLEKLRRGIGNIPLIFTFRTPYEGGSRPIESPAYIRLNELAAMSGMVDIVDVEVNRESVVVEAIISNAHEAGIKVIGSCHDFHKTPDNDTMTLLLKKTQGCGADIVKLAVMPQSMEDVLRLIEVTRKASKRGISKPMITMSMGDMGSISRVCGEYFGSAVTFGSAHQASAPGQFEAEKLKAVLGILHEKAPRPWETGDMPEELFFLTGFMGTGKSTVAERLHAITGMEVIEMDAEIGRRTGRSISQIFDEEGEPYFRSLETALLSDISRRKKVAAIISCGGGVVLRPDNVEIMKSCGRTILLTAKPQTIYERVGRGDGRPNLKNRKTVEDIRELMNERRLKYEAAADIIIETDNKTVDEICHEIIGNI